MRQFKRIERVSVTEEIIEYLKEQVLRGILQPGEHLPSEENLAAQLGVGRGTVREALRVLVYLGLIERCHNVTYVTSIASPKNLPDDFIERIQFHNNTVKVIEVRKIVEPAAAALAAQRASSEEISEIGTSLVAMERHFASVEEFIQHDNEFHEAVFRASENHILLELMRSIHPLLRDNLALVLRRSHTIQPRSMHFHREVYAAIRDGREEDARDIMERHILDVEKEMYVIIREETRKEEASS